MRYDAIVIGGGHNGLVCACYLAGAGLSVRVLERIVLHGGRPVTTLVNLFGSLAVYRIQKAS